MRNVVQIHTFAYKFVHTYFNEKWKVLEEKKKLRSHHAHWFSFVSSNSTESKEWTTISFICTTQHHSISVTVSIAEHSISSFVIFIISIVESKTSWTLSEYVLKPFSNRRIKIISETPKIRRLQFKAPLHVKITAISRIAMDSYFFRFVSFRYCYAFPVKIYNI